MKKQLTLICLIACGFCYGQTTKSTPPPYTVSADSLGIVDVLTVGNYAGQLLPVPDTVVTYDTIPMVMLISDTGRQFYTSMKYTFGNKPYKFFYMGDSVITDMHVEDDTVWASPSNEVFQYFGYSVRSVITENVMRIQDLNNGRNTLLPFIQHWGLETRYAHIKYLDADKKEFRKSIIIWMSKEIK